MNTKNLLIASLIGGLISTALSNIPFLNLVNCLVCAGFWMGPLLAGWIYKRQEGTITLGQSIVVGTVAGLWAGIFGFLLSLVGWAGAEAFINSYAQFIPPEAGFEEQFTTPLSWVLNLVGVGFNIFFGAIGGLIGGLIFQTKPPAISVPT